MEEVETELKQMRRLKKKKQNNTLIDIISSMEYCDNYKRYVCTG